MQRDIHFESTVEFDLAVVGAGIHGAVLACEAAKAGYKVALFDKGDFGGATSANSLKIIHGGIRYLQHGDFKRMRESIRSRRAMMRFAPHLVRPLACMMPTYGHGLRGRAIMRTAFGVYDLIASDRNKDLPQTNHLPHSSSIPAREVAWAVEGIEQKGLTGGAIWYDAIADNTERLILEYVKEASRYGAVVLNYAKVLEVEEGAGRVAGLVVQDEVSGRKYTLRCRTVVNAAGPWLGDLDGSGMQQPLATAVNIIVKKKLFKKYAVGLEGYTEYKDKDAIIKRGKRLFFFVPWREQYTMIGTSYTPYHGKVEDLAIRQGDIVELLGEINRIYPPGDLDLGDVSFFHAGLLPMSEVDEGATDSVQLDKSSKIIDHAKTGGPAGLFSIKGVKYTTAPDIAEKMMALLAKPEQLGVPQGGIYVSKKSIPRDFGPVITSLGERYPEIKTHLRTRYGGSWRELFALLVEEFEKNPDCLLDDMLWLVPGSRLLLVELLYFIRSEMAVTLADVVLRRSELGTAECPPGGVLGALASVMGKELGWSEEECKKEIEQVKRVFAPLTLHSPE